MFKSITTELDQRIRAKMPYDEQVRRDDFYRRRIVEKGYHFIIGNLHCLMGSS